MSLLVAADVSRRHLGPMSRSEILRWLHEEDPHQLAELWRLADETRRGHVGDAVHLRGLIEISNHCVRQCGYCGLRVGSRALTRYRMSADEILAAAQQAVRFGYGTVVLQAGEDFGITQAWMAEVVWQIKAQTPLAVTLSLGERTDEELTAWRAAGASAAGWTAVRTQLPSGTHGSPAQDRTGPIETTR